MQLVETIYGYTKDVTIGKILTGIYSNFRITGFCLYEGAIKFDVMEKHLDDKKTSKCICTIIFECKSNDVVETAQLSTGLAFNDNPQQSMSVLSEISKAAQRSI